MTTSGAQSGDHAGSRSERPSGHSSSPRARPALAVFAIAALFAILLLPAHPRELVPASFLRLPLELPLVVLVLLVLSGAPSVLFRVLVVAAAGTLLLLRLADLGSRLAFDRDFDPLVELHLLGDGWNLASSSVGRLEAGLAVALVLGAFVLLCRALYLGLGGLAGLPARTRRRTGALAAVTLVAGTALSLGARVGGHEVRVQAGLASDIVARARAMHRSVADQNAFVAELADDPLAGAPPPDFAALAGRDVTVIFVESYGRSFIDAERFRGPARTRLARLDERIERAGLHARSAWLTSPIRGGRSWLAHASFASGLPIGNQARFDRLLASPRASLNRLFGQAGWRTAGLMPAIRFAWPEGRWYGFDEIHDAEGLGYAGEPFGWVTMPDQYTLSAYERRIRPPVDARPVMAEIALISSHAPWTPLPEAVPWEDVGDGSVFDGSHRFGDPVGEIFTDGERTRAHYAASLDYSLEVLGGYLARHGRGALTLILGDHQPPSIINGWDATADVPIHVVSDDPALLERLPRALWSDGMLPADELPSQPMAAMRETLARRFGAIRPDPGTAVSARP